MPMLSLGGRACLLSFVGTQRGAKTAPAASLRELASAHFCLVAAFGSVGVVEGTSAFFNCGSTVTSPRRHLQSVLELRILVRLLGHVAG